MAGWYALVDGARDARLIDLVRRSAQHECLYSGDYDAQTEGALPWLVAINPAEPLAQAWQAHESGRFWGILCHSALDFRSLRRRFRKVTTARLPDGEIVLFRFWDPRVFTSFIRYGGAAEIAPLFDGIDCYIADLGPDGRARYEWRDGVWINGHPLAANPAAAPAATSAI